MTENLRVRLSPQCNSTPSSVKAYEWTYRSFLAYLGAQGLPDVPQSFTTQAVLGWCQHEAARVYKKGRRKGQRRVGPWTLDSRLRHLSGLAEYMLLLTDGRNRPLLASNPVLTVPKAKYHRPEEYTDELRAFLAEPRPLNESMARDLFLDTMGRVTELAEANVGDVAGPDEAGGYVLQVQRKGGKIEELPLSPPVVEGLIQYLMTRKIASFREQPQAPLLVNCQGQRWTRGGLTQLVGRIAKKAGIRRSSVSAYTLRQTEWPSPARACSVNAPPQLLFGQGGETARDEIDPRASYFPVQKC